MGPSRFLGRLGMRFKDPTHNKKPSLGEATLKHCGQASLSLLVAMATLFVALGSALAFGDETDRARTHQPRLLPQGLTGHPGEHLIPRNNAPPAGVAGNDTGLPDDHQYVPVAPIVHSNYVNFESPPVMPLALSSDGQRLFITNTPNNSLVVMNTSPDLSKVAEIPVGLDPVAVAVQPGTNNQLVWVVNHISDNVNIVDVSTNDVVGVIEVGDEPVNILFDSTGAYAFVIIQGSRVLQTYEMDPMNLERGNVVVIDTATRSIVSTTFLDMHLPRAAVYDATNQRLIVAALSSGNNTTVVGQPFSLHLDAPMTPVFDLCQVDCECECAHGTSLERLRDFSLTAALFTSSTDLGPVYPDPHDDPLFPMPTPLIQRIIPDMGRPSTWRTLVELLADENGDPDPAVVALFASEFNVTNGYEAIYDIVHDSFDTVDHDLVVLDVSNPANSPSLPIVEYVENVGTTLTGLAIHPTSGDVYVTNMEPRNLVRHEPALNGHIVDHEIRTVSWIGTGMATVSSVDLHASDPNFNDTSAVNATARGISLAQPVALAINADGSNVFTAALGTDRVGALDSSTGEVISRVDVGGGPRGLAFNAASNRLYVLNRTDLSISAIDASNPANLIVLETKSLFNPEPTPIKDGRRFLYSAKFSNNFGSSCATCHIDGHTDHEVWDLGDPAGDLQVSSPNMNDFLTGEPKPNHPIKGPMMTQTLRGLSGHSFYHWRGDRPELSSFNPAFEKLLGGSQLSAADMDLFASFLRSIEYPPNPYFNRDNSFKDPQRALPGVDEFVASCGGCHTIANDGAMFVADMEEDGGVFLDNSALFAQLQEVQQFRGTYAKFDADRYTGFGLLHDGRQDRRAFGHPLLSFIDDLFAGVPLDARDNIVSYLTAFPTNVMSVVGWQVRLSGSDLESSGGNPPAVQDILSMVAQFAKSPSHADVIAKGRIGGASRSFLVTSAAPEVSLESDLETSLSLNDLMQSMEGNDYLVFTAVPPGSGRRIGLDQDEDERNDGVDLFPQHAHTGDSNLDGVINLTDFLAMRSCFLAGFPIAPECRVFDPDANGVLDLQDFNAFLLLYEDTLYDCNHNQVTDLLDVFSGKSLDVDNNAVPDECPDVMMQAAGSRYLAITVTGTDPISIMVSPLNQTQYPQFVDELGYLGSTPVFRLPQEWGTVYVGDQDVVPDMFYVVTIDSMHWTATATATTFRWGDTNNDANVNLDDILCILAAFSGQFPVCQFYGTDLMGYTPDRITNLDDILAVLAAFSGTLYPGPDPGE